MDAFYTVVLVAALLLSAAAGWRVRLRLDERHLSRESIDSVRLMMGMLVTFAALVLGLLTSNAKQRFDGLSDQLSGFATDLIELDHALRVYGPGDAAIRPMLRGYTAAAIASSWPGETPPSGTYPRIEHDPAADGIEGKGLGDLLAAVALQIDRLEPAAPFEARIAAQLRDRIERITNARWQLIFSSHSTISWPFLLTLTTWLAIIFAIFGMTSPPGRVMYVVVGLAALSIASPLYLILDYSSALSGGIVLSSESMRAALAHMDRP